MVHLVCTWLNFPCPPWHSPTRSSHILSNSINFQCHTMLDPVFTVNMSKPSRPTFLDWLVPIPTVLWVLHFSFIQFTPTCPSNHAYFGWLLPCSAFIGQVSVPCIRQFLSQMVYFAFFVINFKFSPEIILLYKLLHSAKMTSMFTVLANSSLISNSVSQGAPSTLIFHDQKLKIHYLSTQPIFPSKWYTTYGCIESLMSIAVKNWSVNRPV